MDAIAALRNKRDTRNYEDKAVPEDLVNQVLNTARMAGSAKNVQPVRMVVVTDPETKTALKASGDYATWIDQAPIVVVATVSANAGPRRMFDVGRHCQNLMVAAYAEGLGSCPVTIHHQDVARDLLGIPADVEPAMIVTLGWLAPSDPPPSIAGPRVAIDDYAHWGTWG